jgi:hypothetical protein
MPSLIPNKGTGGALKAEAAQDFSLRLGEKVAVGAADGPTEVLAQDPGASVSNGLNIFSNSQSSVKNAEKQPAPPQTRIKAEHRSVILPAALSAVFTTLALLHPILHVAAPVFWPLAVVSGVAAVVDAGVFHFAMRRGRGATDAEFASFVQSEVKAGRLDGGMASLIRPLRLAQGMSKLSFGMTAGDAIYLRPELVKTPFLFRMVLLHELHHLTLRNERGPPSTWGGRVLLNVYSELKARAGELRGSKAISKFRVPVFERALRESQLSLKLDNPFDLLVLNPGSKELSDPKLYHSLSGGKAKVETRQETVSEKKFEELYLSQKGNARKYRAVVVGDASSLLTQTHLTRGVAPAIWRQRLDTLLSRPNIFFQGTILENLPLTKLVGSLYAGLKNGGVALFRFGPNDANADLAARLVNAWQGLDSGRFDANLVPLEDGSSVLVARKSEPRVEVSLKPLNGGKIEESLSRASSSPERLAQARKLLKEAGFEPYFQLFEELEIEVRQILGSKYTGREEIIVSLPRQNIEKLQGMAAAQSMSVRPQRTGFKLFLNDVGPIHNIPAVRKLGIKGEGLIFVADTGVDRSHPDIGSWIVDTIDMIGEGIEDWIGHGSHVLGIIMSRNPVTTGLSSARAIMAKIFGKNETGGSEGDIKGALTEGQVRGVDGFSLSFGMHGFADDDLSEFVSNLVRQKNSKGEYPFAVVSAGNEGPFDFSVSHPASGFNVTPVGSATKSLEDGKPSVSFFSAVGPNISWKWVRPRLLFYNHGLVVGGDLDSQGSYGKGVLSVKSKDMEPTPDDSADGKHTRMSGTSQAAPAAAAIMLNIKEALKKSGALTGFVAENLPFVLDLIARGSARDIGVPAWFQDAGLWDAEAAVKSVYPTQTDSLDWIKRSKDMIDLETSVYEKYAQAFKQAGGKPQPPDSPAKPKKDDVQQKKASAAGEQAFALARSAALGKFLEALDAKKEPAWFVRYQAGLALLNLKAAEAAPAMAESILHDPDRRVRSLLALAYAELPGKTDDAWLDQAVLDADPHTRLYAGYIGVRRGKTKKAMNDSAAKMASELGNSDKFVRFTAVWLLGQAAKGATTAESDLLSARVTDASEKDEIRHLSVAALLKFALNNLSALSDGAMISLLTSVGPQNPVLTDTIALAFGAALQNKSFGGRLRAGPVNAAAKKFVSEYKGQPGPLGDLAAMLSRYLGSKIADPKS